VNYIQEAEKRLKHYRDLKRSVEQMDKDIARIVSKATPSELNAVAMDLTGVRGSSDDDTYNILFELQTLTISKRKTEEEIESIDNILKDISKEHDCRLHGKVLYAWYVKRMSKEEIANEIGYSLRQLYNIKNDAIRRFAIRILGIKALEAM
jgi:type II secretory pathway component PulJ